jgi:hypothetical protein
MCLGLGLNAYGYEGPSPLKNIKIAPTTSLDSASGFYSYGYKVTNPSINDGQLRAVRISISRNPQIDEDLSAVGLTYCPHHSKKGAQDNLSKTPMVPVGAAAPNGWSCDYMPDGTFSFGALDDANLIKPGTTSGNFVLKSKGIPSIRDVTIIPAVDYESLPAEWEGDKARLQALQDNVKWVGKTIGPKAPPKVFVGSDFLSGLIAMANQSRTNNWIDSDGILNSLLAKLNDAAKKLNAGDKKTAKNVINAFLQDVQAQNGKHLTAEAYSLLYYNGKYLVDRL